MDTRVFLLCGYTITFIIQHTTSGICGHKHKQMKKVLTFFLSMMTFATVANAQKTTTYHYEDTQARALDMVSKGYVKPLINEVKVDEAKGRQVFSIRLDKNFVENDMKGDVPNIRSYGVFLATEEWKCDVVVAPTFHLYTKENGDYQLDVVGFAGKFINWRTMTDADLDWIRTTQGNLTGNQQIEAVTKPTKTK